MRRSAPALTGRPKHKRHPNLILTRMNSLAAPILSADLGVGRLDIGFLSVLWARGKDLVPDLRYHPDKGRDHDVIPLSPDRVNGPSAVGFPTTPIEPTL